MKSLVLACCLALFPAYTIANDVDWGRQLAGIQAGKIDDHGAALSELMDLYWRWQLDVYPELATYYGEPGDYGRWMDASIDAVRAREKFETDLLAAARRIDRERLAAGQQLDDDLLVYDLETRVAGFRFADDYLVLTQLNGVQQDAAQLLAQMPRRNSTDFEFILSRLERLPELVDQDLEWLRAGMEKGITPPQVTLRDVPGQVQSLLTDDPFASPLLQAFAERPATVSEADWEAMRTRAERNYRDTLRPALERLLQLLEKEYIPAARQSIALSTLPDGVAWYRQRVRRYTTTDMSPEEIHALGLREVARIRAEMDRIVRDAGYGADFQGYTHYLRTDPKFFHTRADDLVREYRDVAKRADAELPRLFGTLPRNTYGVLPVPDYAAKSQTTAYYQPGSLQAGRAGYYFVNTYALESRPRWEMEALTLHEAVPGHHLQISLAQELQNLHPLRRYGEYTAFVEGWALYAESLGEEMGFYRNPASKFGQLTYEMWRAIRLVVDTGMHAKGWSREQAIQFFHDNSAKTTHDIEVEIDRYIVWPGQALAYKIGELKIKSLRQYAQDKLGDRFDIRAFHDHVLEAGALPLDILDRRIRRWVAETAAAQ